MARLIFTRARAITKDVLYTAGVDDNADAAEPLTRAYQYFHGKWEYGEFPASTQRIALYRRTEGGRIAVYMSRSGELFSPEPSFQNQSIHAKDMENKKKLGYLADLRQVASQLLACGDGGQNYCRMNRDTWAPMDISIFDDYVDVNWAFEIKARGNTGAEQDRYWEENPELKRERTRRISLFNKSLSLHAINGPSLDNLYLCGAKGAVYFWNGERMEKLSVPTSAYLLDILVEDPDTIWICGRNGTLLRGNARQGFTAIPCDDGPTFSTLTRFDGRIYLSSISNPRGVFVHDGRTVRQVASGLRRDLADVHTVDAVEGALWAVGSRDVARFDGTAWERIKIPKWSD